MKRKENDQTVSVIKNKKKVSFLVEGQNSCRFTFSAKSSKSFDFVINGQRTK